MIDYYIEKTYNLFLKDIEHTLYNESFFHDILLKYDIPKLVSCCFVLDKKDTDVLCWYIAKHISFREQTHTALYAYFNQYVEKYNDIHIGIFTYLMNVLLKEDKIDIIESLVQEISVDLETIPEDQFLDKHYMLNYYKMLETVYSKLHKDITNIHNKIIDITFCNNTQEEQDVILIQKKEHNNLFKIINPTDNILASLLEHKDSLLTYDTVSILFTNIVEKEKTKFILQKLRTLHNVSILENASLQMIDYL
jgi:hypothetical protein